MKIKLQCDFCGKEMERYPSQIKAHNFCSARCLGAFSSKSTNPEGYAFRDFSKNSARFSAKNAEWNKDKMTPDVRAKLRQAKLKPVRDRKSYPKMYGRHEHRVVAEELLGRPLQPGEVVHHIDGDKQNNAPDNLMVFPSQSEHARHHAKLRAKGGGAQ